MAADRSRDVRRLGQWEGRSHRLVGSREVVFHSSPVNVGLNRPRWLGLGEQEATICGTAHHSISVTVSAAANCHHYMHSFVEILIWNSDGHREEESSFDAEILLDQIEATVHGVESEAGCSLAYDGVGCDRGLWESVSAVSGVTVVFHLGVESIVEQEIACVQGRGHRGLVTAANEILGDS